MAARLTVVLLVAVAFAVVAVLVVTSEEADAWSQGNYYGDGSSNTYKSGDVAYYRYFGSYTRYQYYKYSDSTPEVQEYYYSGSGYSYYYTYKAYVGFDISSIADNVNINSARIYFSISSYSGYNGYVYVRFLRLDASVADGYQVYRQIDNYGYNVGSTSVTSTGTYYVTVSGGALTWLKNKIASDDGYLYVGFDGNPSTNTYCSVSSTSSRLWLEYDASAPSYPRPNSLPRYTGSNSVTVSWGSVSDQPSGGNSGLDTYPYQMGVFTSNSLDSLWWSTGWTSSTSYSVSGFDDDVTYLFRVRARDRYGFTSSWSTYAYTTFDFSPPTVPVLAQEPLHTAGGSNTISWSASTDAGSGVSRYLVQYSTRVDFAGASTYYTSSTQRAFSSLADGVTYYYRVASQDDMGHVSGWSVPQYSQQDDAAPSVPVMMDEPTYTDGTRNTYNWHPSTDAGVGVMEYDVQVAESGSFHPGDILYDVSTTATTYKAYGLDDGKAIFCRVRAKDHFGYISAWSQAVVTIMDNSGPTDVGLHPLPTYTSSDPVVLHWNGSGDDGVGLSHYTVWWSNETHGMGPGGSQDYVLGHMAEVPDLDHGETWYFWVRAVDLFGNLGPVSEVNTTVDREAPVAPVVDAEPEHTAGTENTITWAASTDDLSGVDHYVVRVFARAGGSGLVFTDVTDALSMTVPGLADGATYWYEVSAVDVAGNANASVLVHSMQDATPPTEPDVPPMPDFSPGDALDVSWDPALDWGSGGVTYMLEWSASEDFGVLAGSSDWTTDLDWSVSGLADGTTYYFRVKARDALEQESRYGDVAMTTMDASAPPVPLVHAPDAYVPGPMVDVSWDAVVDGSGQPVEYMVMAYDTDTVGAAPVTTSPWTGETRHAMAGLTPDAVYYLRVVARDPLGWTSDASDAVHCTIDATGPSAAVIDDGTMYVGGTVVTIGWTAGVDAGIGGVMHRLVVYSDEAMTSRVYVGEWTAATEADAYGLPAGAPRWFVVEAKDAFDNVGEASDAVVRELDRMPPTLAETTGMVGPTTEAIAGSCTDGGSGVASVEVTVNGGDTWLDATLDGDDWSFDIEGVPVGTTEVWIRATDAVGNTVADWLMVVVDRDAPTVGITSPEDGAEVSGAVVIMGSVQDAHMASYTVEYKASTASTWSSVQPEQATSGVAGVLATWVTAGMAGGNYELRVTAKDALQQSSSDTVSVVLKGAHLSIGPGDITFSDSHPLPGDKVTVLVTVRNDGDSPAEDVTVTLTDKGTQVGSQSGVTVPAHGVATVPFELEAKGDHELKAEASSDLYDTGAMESGQPLQTIEEEAALENAGGIIGLLALILALVAIMLVFIMGRRGGGSGRDDMPSSVRDDIVLDPVLEEPVQAVEPQPLPSPTPTPPGGEVVEGTAPPSESDAPARSRFDRRPPRGP